MQKVVKLNLNYRSTQNIVGASNEVISHNKFKVEKEIHASKMSEHKIVVYAGNSENDNLQFCNEKVQELLADGLNNEDIFFYTGAVKCLPLTFSVLETTE